MSSGGPGGHRERSEQAVPPDSFNPCLLVPVYNPGPALTRTLDALLATGHTLFVQDDGSDEPTQRELERFREAHPRLRCARWETNQGKGAAVAELFRRAWAEGFTHGLQVDADGQHDAGAVKTFMALGEANPQAVIAGVPAYEGPVPAARRYGRRFTHAWVWLETLSFDIGDSLCGFRLYPLETTVRLLKRVPLPNRMDFDTAAIVRLHWEGLPVLNAPVTVVYPEDGVSHFNLLRDNLRLTRMHTRLVLGMLLRLPRLLWRKCFPHGPTSAGPPHEERGPGGTSRAARAGGPPGQHWSHIHERGTALGLRMTLWTYRLLGARGLQFITEFVVAYFFVTGTEARRASKNYLARLFEQAGPLPDLPHRPGIRDQYRHIRAFAHSYVDRFLAWIHAADVLVAFPEEATFRAQITSGQGALFLSAHLGNLDMLRGLAATQGLSGLNAVVYSEHVVRFQNLLKDLNPNYEANLIHVADVGPGTAMVLEEKVAKGESLFIVGDRPPVAENGRTLRVPFLGGEAPFPIGPLFLAHLLQCPVYLFFCVQEGRHYVIHMERFAERVHLPRKDRDTALKAYLEAYAAAVEAQCRRTPLQWFNFYDFWGEDSASSSGPAPTL